MIAVKCFESVASPLASDGLPISGVAFRDRRNVHWEISPLPTVPSISPVPSAVLGGNKFGFLPLYKCSRVIASFMLRSIQGSSNKVRFTPISFGATPIHPPSKRALPDFGVG